MSTSILQAKNGGTGTATGPSPLVSTSTAVGFDAATTDGSTLIAIAFVRESIPSGSELVFAPPLISTPAYTSRTGRSWSSIAQTGWFDTVGDIVPEIGVIQGFYIQNAPSMLITELTTVIAQDATGGGADFGTIKVEFKLYEVGGVLTASPLAAVNAFTGTGTVPFTGNTTVSGAPGGFLMCAFTALPGAADSAGSGFTLGLDATLTTIGQTQYNTAIASGIQPCSFSGSSQPLWAGIIFELKAAPSVTPTITSVSPSSGSVTGGTPITITGTDFLSGAAVTFGGVTAAIVVVISSTQITCVTPAHAAGSVTVSVIDSDGTASLADGFLYVDSGGSGGTVPIGGSGFTGPQLQTNRNALPSSTFIYRQQVGDSNEPQWGQGLANFLQGRVAVAQALRTRLLLLEGEWWESLLDGTPLWQSILGVSNTQQQISLLLQQRILGTPYVLSLTNLQVKFDRPSRALSFYAEVQTAFGQVIVNNAL